MNTKITPQHHSKPAYIYIRQSTLAQVRHHQESTERQYALRDKALALGWPDTSIRILDRDLGQSGAQMTGREDFKTLVADVSMGQVGAVFALEVSRLARSNLDWHRLLELCALTGTLVIDADGCYDPGDFNDGLLLGLKGTMAQAELHFLRGRLQGGKLNKAQKGELRFPLPVGLCYDDEGRIVLDPDDEVRGAVQLVFRLFQETGSAYAVVKRFAEDGLRFPKRAYGGAWAGRLIWGRLRHERVLGLIRNPPYAGVYVFGRYQYRQRITPQGEVHKRVQPVPQADWRVHLADHHEGYITPEQFERNQARLARNRTNGEGTVLSGPAREGLALLQGMLICGCCGRALNAASVSREETKVMSGIDKMLAEERRHEEQDLRRGLKSRHIQMIALGGAIGVGLFLGAGRAISIAGPGLILSYAIGGIMIFFIMRALGELLMYRPVAGSFASYAEEFVGPFAGFATGWSYWFMWITIGMAEITAVAVYVHYWFPDIPQWIPALATLVVLYFANRIAVAVFGELEFWFALIKIAMLVAMIGIGLAILLFGATPLGATSSVSNLWTHQGFMPFGVLGVALTLPMVMFAFQGVELIGVTAGEAQNPERVLPQATNSVVWRILIFYIGALLVMMSLVPWTELKPGVSPFVFLFEKMGIPGAASVINFVVITAAASSCNSGIFSTGRMLYTLAQFRQAPQAFARVNANHVPATAITFSAILMGVGVVLNYVVPEEAFVWITSISLVSALWTWSIIMIAHVG